MQEKLRRLLTKAAANSNSLLRCKHAAAVVHKRVVVAVGVNELKTHPMMGVFNKNEEATWLHAEISALSKVLSHHDEEFLSSCSLYSLRTLGGGHLGLARPCEGCSSALLHYRLKEVWYTDPEVQGGWVCWEH